MKNTAATRWILFLVAFTISYSVIAQEPATPKKDGERFMFVEIKDLNESSFASLSNAMSLTESMTIKSACVPANVIMLTIPSSNSYNLDDNFHVLRDIVYHNLGPLEVNLLAEYSEESFMKRCKQYRGSGQP